MNVDTGKWNWARIKELTAFMEDPLKKEASVMQTSCFDGDYSFSFTR